VTPLARIRAFPLEAVCVVLLLLICVVVLLQVLSRYLLTVPLSWTEEFARFLLIWMSFLGAVVCLDHKQHLAIDMLTARMPPRFRRLNANMVQLLLILFMTLCLWKGLELVRQSLGQQSVIMGIPYSVFYVSIPFMAALILYRLIGALYRHRSLADEQEP